MTDASSVPAAGPLTPETRVVTSPDAVSAEIADETVILGMRDSVYYGLEGVGSRLWSLASKGITLGEMHAAIVREYEVEPSAAWTDLVAVVKDLLAAGLLEATPPSTR